jgi:hypothetical protein
MPEETKSESLPATPDAPATKTVTAKKTNALPVMMIGGVVALLVLVLGAAAVWFFMNQTASQNTAVLLSDPKNIVDAANTGVKTYVKDLTVAKLEALSKDPSAAYTQLYGNLKDEAYDFDLNIDFASNTGSSSSATTSGTRTPAYNAKVDIQGKVSTLNKKMNMEGAFDANVGGSGLSLNLKGEFKLVGEKFYIKVTDGGELFRLPTGWIGIDLKDAAAQAGGTTGLPTDGTMTAAERAELEKTITKLKSFQGDVMINTKAVANRTVKNESLKCVQTEINPALANALADEKEVDEARKAIESFTPYTICSNGETKPVLYSIGANIDEGSTKGTFLIEMIMTKLASAPSIIAPAASEVTDLSEMTGK